MECVTFEFSYGLLVFRTPWLPPCVLYVCRPTAHQFCTPKSSDGGSQAERADISCRRRTNACTISRASHTAWEVRVSAVPDFRLHPSSEFGSLIFCQLGSTKCQRTDPSKIPFSQTHINCKIRLQQLKSFCGAFSKKRPFPPSSTLASPQSL